MGKFPMSPELWKYEVQDVKRTYPDAKWYERNVDGVRTIIWRLNLNPIPDDDVVHCILADLDAGRMVGIGVQGKIFHSTNCNTSTANHPILLPKIRLERQAYLVDFVYRPPVKNSPWSVQPIARIVWPEISAHTYPNHPHMYSGNGSWACPLSPQDKQWKWGKGATVAYLDQVSIWLLKTMVWIQTGAGIAGLGKWIGPDTSHKPLSLNNTIWSYDPCWCGGGLRYSKCHQQSDLLKTIVQRRPGNT